TAAAGGGRGTTRPRSIHAGPGSGSRRFPEPFRWKGRAFRMSERCFSFERTASMGGCQGTEMVGLPYNAFVLWPATVTALSVTLGAAGLPARATPDLGTRDR